MKIDLNQIPPEGLELSEACPASELGADTSEVKYEGSIQINAKVSKYGNTANVDAYVKAVVACRCSRCLEDFKKQLDNKYSFNYSPESGDTVANISEDVRQELIMSYTVKNLCKADCKGLCPHCGENLNEGNCSCAR